MLARIMATLMKLFSRKYLGYVGILLYSIHFRRTMATTHPGTQGNLQAAQHFGCGCITYIM